MEVEELLNKLGQKKLFQEYKTYSLLEKEELQNQLLSFDHKDMESQRQSFFQKIQKEHEVKPLLKSDHFSEGYRDQGIDSLERAEVAVVVLAGGMASRLNHTHSKGMFKISMVKQKSLFQLLCEKTLAAQKKYGKIFYLSIMTSNNNHEETVEYFRDNKYFGLDKKQVDFFIQRSLPFLDDNGDFVMEKRGKIAAGPDGNGCVFNNLKNSSILKKYEKNNIKYMSIIPIDNPLADPFDEVFLGYHKSKRSAVSLIAIEKDDDKLSMGVIAKDEKDNIKVIEYMHLSATEKRNYLYLNTGIFLVTLDFIKNNNFIFPIHNVRKTIKKYVDKREGKENIWKGEKFIFDILDYCSAEDAFCSNSICSNVICFSKNRCYAPLKNGDPSSLEYVQRAIYEKDKLVFSEITGKKPEDRSFELAADFHYPTKRIFEKWRGSSLPKSSYVEP